MAPQLPCPPADGAPLFSTPLFSDVMALEALAGQPGRYDADLNANWTIGPKPHGGVMIALCANAARAAYAANAANAALAANAAQTADSGQAHPVAVSANYLSAPDTGPVRLVTSIRKRGRRIGLVDVELVQGVKTCVHAVVTLGAPEHDARPLFLADHLAGQMAPEPPDDVLPIGAGHPGAGINNLARGCDIRPQVVETEGDAPVFRIWVRPKAERVDELFALMCGDISLPVPYAVGRRGWAPTVQLTAYLRALPADGWLRVVCTATEIGQDWFDEDHTVVDSSGRIVVQTRQLALVPPG
jgi:hypothetical protein